MGFCSHFSLLYCNFTWHKFVYQVVLTVGLLRLSAISGSCILSIPHRFLSLEGRGMIQTSPSGLSTPKSLHTVPLQVSMLIPIYSWRSFCDEVWWWMQWPVGRVMCHQESLPFYFYFMCMLLLGVEDRKGQKFSVARFTDSCDRPNVRARNWILRFWKSSKCS